MDRVSAVVAPATLRQGAPWGALLRLPLLLAILTVPACRQAPAPLSQTFESPEALAGAVLEALATRDTARLSSLALTEAEFRTRIWPELPASRPERNLTADYLWKDLKQKSDGSLQALLSTLGGQRFELRRIEFAGETTDYATFSVSRKSELVVSDGTGAEQRIKAFGSVLRADGRVKLFSYVVD
jgi:hypothetical protein